MEKLDRLLRGNSYTKHLVKSILGSNNIVINDGITTSSPIEQTTGVLLQGDPLSPLLFITAMADNITDILSERVISFIYADDMVLASSSQVELQSALDPFELWVLHNDLRLNRNKTKSMTFRKGGKPAIFHIAGKPLEGVPHYK